LTGNLNAYSAHETAIIDAPAKIGKGTQIRPFSHILKGSIIGKNCKFGQNVVVGPDVKIGNNVKIQNNVSVYKGVVLEDEVFCGPSVVFTNVLNPRSRISRMKEALPTLVKKRASLGANAAIICGNTIGRYAFVGAGTVVTKDVPDFALVYGNPAKLVGWMCECETRIIPKNHKARCSNCGKKYKIAARKARKFGTKSKFS